MDFLFDVLGDVCCEICGGIFCGAACADGYLDKRAAELGVKKGKVVLIKILCVLFTIAVIGMFVAGIVLIATGYNKTVGIVLASVGAVLWIVIITLNAVALKKHRERVKAQVKSEPLENNSYKLGLIKDNISVTPPNADEQTENSDTDNSEQEKSSDNSEPNEP